MALIDVALGDNETQTISEENGADQENTVTVSALGNSELIVDGVAAEITSISGVESGSSPTFTTTNGGDLTLDMGLLDVDASTAFLSMSMVQAPRHLMLLSLMLLVG